MLKGEREKEFEMRVFLRSYQDAVTCVSQIASRKYSLKLYTDFIKILTTAVKRNQILFNKEGDIAASTNLQAVQIYENLRFARLQFVKYQFDKVSSKSELGRKLKNGIEDLEKEIQKKAAQLEEEINKLDK